MNRMMGNKIAGQGIEFQKAAFDNTFNVISMFQDQTEKAFYSFLEGSMWPMPEEGKKMLNEWVQSLKKGREEFKKVMDDGFIRVENYFTQEKSE